MAAIDLHVHTSKSPCGLHTLLEILDLARDRGMELLAITDHDHGGGHSTRVMSYRFPEVWNNVRVLKGMEFSIRDGGDIRVPELVKVGALDICLAGFHAEARSVRDDPKRCTDDLEEALEHHPFIDILTHPTITGFNLEHERCARLLARFGVAAEVNNSALCFGKEEEEQVLSLLAHCKTHGVLVALNSDTHAAPELGTDERSRILVQRAGIPAERILTSSTERVLRFVDQRRPRKQSRVQPGIG